MKKLMIPMVAAAALCGCTSIDYYREGDVDPQLGMCDKSCNPYFIDYTVENARKTGSGHSECWFWFFSSNDGKHMSAPGFTFDTGLREAKDSATYDAVAKAKCDALLGAQYKYSRTSKFLGIYKCTDCEVIGFPAHVKSINLINPSERGRSIVIGKDQQVVPVKPMETIQNYTGVPAPDKSMGIFNF